MIVPRIVRQFALISFVLLIAVGAFGQAQPGKSEYEPLPYQEGKDVVWVPTAQALTDKMLDLAKVTPQDYVIDLGSGDGRIVITAARRGARAFGIEYNPDLVALSIKNAIRAGVADRAQFAEGDLFESDFSKATVVTMFLLPDINLKLRPKILDLKPGTRVVSNSFDMAEWNPDQTVQVKQEEGCTNSFCKAYLWIVPAKVEGAWSLPQGKLSLVQRFQRVFGELNLRGKIIPVANGRIDGDHILFSIGHRHYSGRVNGNTMSGTVKAAGKTSDWEAKLVDNKLF
ncbi:MAG: class I SAM-dependent methyltransferase [Deltaproteobacteria bacterium]|nr:class I SAM-dependent methyltransferase [Deltaproteobacteria bacterium]